MVRRIVLFFVVIVGLLVGVRLAWSSFPWIVNSLNYYSNLVIAIFTAVAAIIAAVQVLEFFRGAEITLHFPLTKVGGIGPVFLEGSKQPVTPLAVFFDLPIIFANQGPKVGVVTQLEFVLVSPSPKPFERTNPTPSAKTVDAYQLHFRFESEEAANAPFSDVLLVAGNSSGAIRARVAILLRNLQPGTSSPPATGLDRSVVLRAEWRETRGKRLISRKAEQTIEFRPAIYNELEVKNRMNFLHL